MGGTSNTQLDGCAYIKECIQIAKHLKSYKDAKFYISSALPEIANFGSFQQLCKSLAQDTNSGRLTMTPFLLYLYSYHIAHFHILLNIQLAIQHTILHNVNESWR